MKTFFSVHAVKWSSGLLLTIIAAAGIYFFPGWQDESLAGTLPTVSYPVATFSDGKARQFQYKTSDGQTIRYFVLKSSDGVVRAAFDACDVCWPHDKGYQQDGDFMVCKNCGRRFQSTKVNVVTGGCNPSALQRNIQDDKVVIQVKDIEDGRRFFRKGG
jgi:uncharacterized membrane protein